MKNRKNLLVLILSISLAAAGSAGLTILATESYVLAQSAKLPSVQTITNNSQVKKNDLKSKAETLSAIFAAFSVVIGVITYYRNESWKHRQYIEEKIKDFENKLETINVRKMLSSELQCVELFPFLEKPTYRFVVVEDCLWAEALHECK